MFRLNVLLDESEFDALIAIAKDECRHPREQARFLLHKELERRGLLTNTPVGEAHRVETPQLIEAEEAKHGT